jgi:hypothetical protein
MEVFSVTIQKCLAGGDQRRSKVLWDTPMPAASARDIWL